MHRALRGKAGITAWIGVGLQAVLRKCELRGMRARARGLQRYYGAHLSPSLKGSAQQPLKKTSVHSYYEHYSYLAESRPQRSARASTSMQCAWSIASRWSRTTWGRTATQVT